MFKLKEVARITVSRGSDGKLMKLFAKRKASKEGNA